jgi:isochorismate synthase EntC
VWSREAQLPGDLARSTLAQRMRQARPDAWNVDVQLPNGENFLGATPELLVACRKDRLTAMALAGTGSRAQLLADDARLDDEHDRVRQFVQNRLETLGVTALETQSDVAQAGVLNHRRTAMTGTRPRHLDALTAALTLHPTPALLGLPRAEALAMLEQVETPRGLYGGCLGRLASDGSGQGEVVVLLRGVVQRGATWQARAGAGLVPGSSAIDEAREIAHKLAAIVASLLPVLP